MNNPVLWLCLSLALVAVSLTAVFVVLIPAVVELSRAARSFEKLCNTLDRDLPPTLDSLRQTTAEITRLTDDVNASVQNAGRVAQQVDQSVNTVRSQAKRAHMNTRSLMTGLGAAWTTFHQTAASGKRDRPQHSPTVYRQPAPRHPDNSIATASDAPDHLEEITTANTEGLKERNESDRDKGSPSSETSTVNGSSSQVMSD